MAEVEGGGQHVRRVAAAGRRTSPRTPGRPAPGCPRSPSRSGSSPIAISSSRTAASARAWSNAARARRRRPASVPRSASTIDVTSRDARRLGRRAPAPRSPWPAVRRAAAAPAAAVRGAVGRARWPLPRPRPAPAGVAPAARSDGGALAESQSTRAHRRRFASGSKIRGDLGLVERLLLEQLERRARRARRGSRSRISQASSWAPLDERADLLVDRSRRPPRSSRARGPCRGRGRPRRCAWPSLIAPSRSLMPYCVTIARATRGGLLDVVATRRWSGRGRPAPRRRGRPACRPAGRASRCGSWSTCPRRAAPSCSRGPGRAGRIVTLCTGSVCGSAAATSAWPPSW